jgi:dTDP-4-dehydrorhamnose 3,5-epimerase
MELRTTPIVGLFLAATTPLCDQRGSFTRLFCSEQLSMVIGNRTIVQMNHSRTNTLGAIRGLHFQRPPYAEMKLVRCIRGRVWDVAVDIRYDSRTFLHWHAQELTPDNGIMMVIPEGFAHGFQVLQPESELLYLHTAPYHPGAEGGLRFNDPKLSISWPLAITDLSIKDQSHLFISDNFKGLSV